ncbi:uncharacterized protein DAT39_013384, partial [Clarias magur]
MSSATIPSEVSNPVIQPLTPYVGSIAGVLRPGMRFHVEGTVHPNAHEFQINFKAGVNNGDDVAFHFNPRIGQNVTMNAFLNGQWMMAELGSNMPFVRGASFKLLFIVYKDFYEVHVNGMRFYTFNHRIPLDRITTLAISGDISIIWLGFEDWRQTFTYSIPSVVSNPIIQPSIPYIGPVAGGIRPGMQLHVEGAIPSNAKQFQINFKTGLQDGDDTAFHFNPRIGQSVYMNVFRNGQWQKEELGQNKPFVGGASFNLLFIINRDFYEVHVNGEHIYRFNHRIPVDRVNTLGISGDVLIRWLGFATESTTPKTPTPPSPSMSSISLPLDIMYPISNPRLPYVKTPGGLKEEMAFFLQGTILTNAASFAINFKTGPGDAEDVAFHYRPWLKAKTVLNSFQNGWKEAEDVHSVPFTRGETFILLIAIMSDCYKVYVNGQRHCTFRHRIPLEKVSTVQICENVATNVCGFIDNWSTHLSFAELKGVTESSTSIVPFLPLETSYPINFPEIPYANKIPTGLKPGMAMFVYGTVLANAVCFAVNFKTGRGECDDIAFHYNPRFSGETVLNTFKKTSGWGTPENLPGLPFTRESKFQIIFAFKSEGYKVYVNGSKHCTFKHRIALENVSAIEIPRNPGKTFSGVTIQFIGFVERCVFNVLICKLKSWNTTSSIMAMSLISLPIEIFSTTSNPGLPDVPFKNDMVLFLQGVILPDADRFVINFKSGNRANSNIAFHYNPRLNDRTALNTFKDRSWGTEEFISSVPFTKGGAFIILVAVTSAGYEVFVNGVKHCTFQHRLPLEEVYFVNICGKVAIYNWGFIENGTTSSAFTSLKKVTQSSTSVLPDLSLLTLSPISYPALTYSGKIAKELKEGMAMFLYGTLHERATDVAISFRSPDILVDNVVLSFCLPASKFTRAKFTGQMIFAFKSEGFEVYVNGSKYYTNKNRIPLDKITTIVIPESITVQFLGFVESWNTTSSIMAMSLISLPFEIISTTNNTQGLPDVSFKNDMVLFLQGVIPADADRFVINFKTGPSPIANIAFHYNPRLNDRTALNTFKDRSWGTEEFISSVPFTKGGAFIILVAVTSAGYEAYVNGSKYYTHKNPVPLDKVATITVQFLGFVESWNTTSSIMAMSLISLPFEIISTTNNTQGLPDVPFKNDMVLFLQGVIPVDADRFVINFKTGPSPIANIAFHYNPRLNDRTALNTFKDRSWGTEEFISSVPFTKGGAFIILVAVTSAGYEVFVNGAKHCTFQHHLPLEDVFIVNIGGNVAIYNWGIID